MTWFYFQLFSTEEHKTISILHAKLIVLVSYNFFLIKLATNFSLMNYRMSTFSSASTWCSSKSYLVENMLIIISGTVLLSAWLPFLQMKLYDWFTRRKFQFWFASTCDYDFKLISIDLALSLSHLPNCFFLLIKNIFIVNHTNVCYFMSTTFED